MKTLDIKSFNYLESGEVTYSCFDTVINSSTMLPGNYIISYSQRAESVIIQKEDIATLPHKIHNFPDKQKIDDLFTSFFKKEVAERITTLGLLHKTGILFYGKEGTGKSTIIKHYCNRAIAEHNAIVFIITSVWIRECWELIKKIRYIQENPIIIVLEEFDGLMGDHNEAVFKTILDGNLSIDNCVFFATTNYIDKIPNAIKMRPSRFKYVLNIESIQNKEDVYSCLNDTIGSFYTSDDINKFSEDLKGKSLDVIKQFCVDKIMNLKTYSSNTSTPKIGFI